MCASIACTERLPVIQTSQVSVSELELRDYSQELEYSRTLVQTNEKTKDLGFHAGESLEIEFMLYSTNALR